MTIDAGQFYVTFVNIGAIAVVNADCTLQAALSNKKVILKVIKETGAM